jgi:hypothetical protein
LDGRPQTSTIPNLHRKRTIKENVIKILLWTITDNTLQRTLNALILQSPPSRDDIPAYAPKQVFDFGRAFKPPNTLPVAFPTKMGLKWKK